ncbi:MAG: hypothetical protein IK114_11445 [Fibrobacter sp.]|nr:hypothetical protein [Fibrobacter sp.]
MFIRLMLALVFACAFVACDSGSNSADPDPVAEISSSSGVDDDISSSSVTDKGKSSSGSSKSSSSVKSGDDSQKSSSSVNGGGNSSSVDESSSSSMRRRCEEGSLDTMVVGDLIGYYECKNNKWELVSYVESSSSDVHYDMTEQFYCDGSSECECASEDFTDPRDNQVYKTINVYTKDADRNTIVAYRVFAENLNYGKQIKNGVLNSDDNAVEKYCYNDDDWYCDNGFGGLYTWSEAMGLPKACDTLYVDSSAACKDAFVPPGGRSEKMGWYVQRPGICPEGWHVMNYVEWLVLSDIGGLSLKSSVAWSNWVGSNYYGFSALPVGYIEDGKYDLFGTYAVFIEPQEHDNLKAKVHYIMENSHREASVQKSFASSIRCVEDYETNYWE